MSRRRFASRPTSRARGEARVRRRRRRSRRRGGRRRRRRGGRRARRRGRRRGRSRTTRTRREACRRRAHRPRETCGVGYVSHGGVRSRGDDAIGIVVAVFQDGEGTKRVRPNARRRSGGEDIRRGSRRGGPRRIERRGGGGGGGGGRRRRRGGFRRGRARGRAESAPTSSSPTSSSPSSSSPSSSSRRVVDSDAFDPVFTAGCLALDAWASTADASGRVIAPFSSVEIAYQLVARCLDALTFEHGASRASDRRLSVLEYSDADDDAGGVTERRRTKRRRDGLHPRARWEAFTRAARAIRAARALSRTYDADPEANARALIPPIELAILANALMRFAPLARASRGFGTISGRISGRTISGMISGTISRRSITRRSARRSWTRWRCFAPSP